MSRAELCRDPVRRVVWDFLCRHLPVADTRPLVVGVSGGPDSMALLDAAHAVARGLDRPLVVAHLDHALRPDSAADAAFVCARADHYVVPVHVERLQPNALATAGGLEAAARTARYELFARVVVQTGAAGVLVAHTLQDQAETFLLRLLRGGGALGLSGMRAIRQIKLPSGASVDVLRPLLAVTPEELAAYRARWDVPSRHDSTNDDLRFARNQIRHVGLPALQAIQPAAVSVVARAASLLAELDDFVQQQSEATFHAIAALMPAGVSFDRGTLRSQPPVLRKALFRRAYRQVAGSLDGLERVHVDAADALLTSRSGGFADWPGSVRVVVDQGAVSIRRWSLLPEGRLAERPLLVPGLTAIPESSLELTTELVSVPCSHHLPDHVDLDLDATGSALVVRSWRPGDRLRPPGMGGTKKLQDLFVDAKVPRERRALVPLLASSSAVLWVSGLRPDERYLASAASRRILCVRCRPWEGESAS